MARSWLEVTTDEVRSKMGANERLAERREAMGTRARGVVDETVAPVFKAAAEQREGWHYLEDHDTEWAIVRCGIHSPGDVERDPTVAFFIAEFDAYQPLVILRAKAEGAAAQPRAEIVRLDDLDGDTVERFLADA